MLGSRLLSIVYPVQFHDRGVASLPTVLSEELGSAAVMLKSGSTTAEIVCVAPIDPLGIQRSVAAGFVPSGLLGPA